METNVSGFYAQVFSIGLVWVFFHCGGMCGPIVAGVTADVRRGSPGREVAARAGRVLSYQFGRATTYAVLGAFAGMVGGAFESALRQFTQSAGLILAAVLIAVGLAKLPIWRRSTAGNGLARWTGDFLGKAMLTLQRRGPKSGALRYAMLGAMLGLLPCMLMFWVLSIATSTASPIHGAGVMVLLVAMTTPTLLFAGTAAAFGGRRFNGDWVASLAMVFSGVWLGLIASAANGWLEHIHVQFTLWGDKYVLMLW